MLSAISPTPATLPSMRSPGCSGADAFGRAGEDQVARLQVIELRQVLDQLGDVPDQLVEVGGLARLAVDAQRRARRSRAPCPASARSRTRPTTAPRPCPGPTAGPCRARPVAGRGASCRGRRRSRRSAWMRRHAMTRKPGVADHHHQFHLVVVVLGLRRIGHGRAGLHQRRRALGEVEGRFDATCRPACPSRPHARGSCGRRRTGG